MISKAKNLEALIVLENGTISVKKILKNLKIKEIVLSDLIDELNCNYKKINSIIWVRRREDEVEFFIDKNYNSDFLELYKQKKGKLKRATLETLSIIAYNQPVTLPEIEDVRGIISLNQLKFLLAENLIIPVGKKDTAGNPTIFKTSPHFLDRFNLSSIKDLPEMEEIKAYSFLEVN